MRVHIDYLTLVSPEPISRISGNEVTLYHWALSVAYGGEQGYTLAPKTVLGYKGYQVGSLFYGERHDGCMLRISGEAAHIVAREVAEWGMRATRIDLAVDAKEGEYTSIDEELARSITSSKRERSRQAGRPWKIHPHGDGDRVTNVDIGARTSPLYLRIYDKGVESGADYAGLLRYECELKKDYARYAWDKVSLDPDDISTMYSLAYTAFADRGVYLPWNDDVLEYHFDIRAAPLPDDERSLEWLSRQVSPTVRRLTNSVERDRILLALGLLQAQDMR